jgi:prolyl-tRNA editing enzyme YbaK/EbsC (Cys-tRNA(Pro) deacylase)
MTSNLYFMPAIEKPDLVSPSVAAFLKNCQEVQVAEIDPAFAGGHEFCSHYQIPLTEGANCVIVEATRGEASQFAACVAPVSFRIDFNGAVRKTLNARRVSLAPLDQVLKVTGMEFGSITPVGLPQEWIILIDSRLVTSQHLVIGSGLLKSKLRLPTTELTSLPQAKVIEGLAVPSKHPVP